MAKHSEFESHSYIIGPKFFSDYLNDDQSFDDVVSIMVGDLQRIIEYPKKVIKFSKIPEKVRNVQDYLIQQGFKTHLLQQKI